MTELLAASAETIAYGADLLRAGELVAFGTETVYGLGADATNAEAVARIFVAKGRPSFNPLIAHYPTAKAAFADVEPTDAARKLAAAFWPGPLTMVLRRRADCPVALIAGAGLETLAVRVPSHPDAMALLAATGRAVAAPSANPSGRVSPTTAQHVMDGLGGKIAAVIDSGACPVGVESTVVDVSGEVPVLLRPGGVTLEELQAVVGPVARGAPIAGEESGVAPFAPGMLASHYAPALPVRLNVADVAGDEGLIAFGPALPGAASVYQLSERRDTTEAASRLFDALRSFDAVAGLRGIAVMPVPLEGLGLAINDRLSRAASPRL
jgi:L-threonylcarbamoyladenylate synthase